MSGIASETANVVLMHDPQLSAVEPSQHGSQLLMVALDCKHITAELVIIHSNN